jgi:hypothetical protein
MIVEYRRANTISARWLLASNLERQRASFFWVGFLGRRGRD